MKKRTAEILDTCTNGLEPLGFKHRKRTLAVRLNENGLFEVVSFQPREYPGGLLKVTPYLGVIWTELEKLYWEFLGGKYRFGEGFSVVRPAFPEKPFLFDAEGDFSEGVERIVQFLKECMADGFTRPSSTKKISEALYQRAISENYYPERSILAEFLNNGMAAAKARIDHLPDNVLGTSEKHALIRFLEDHKD